MEQQMVRLQAALEASEIQADRSSIKSYLERKTAKQGERKLQQKKMSGRVICCCLL